MSVKRRLYFSNILMLMLPIVLMIVTSMCMVLIYSGVTGARELPPLKYSDQFFEHMEDVDQLATNSGSSTDVEVLQSAIDQFNVENLGSGLDLSLYAGNHLLYPETLPNEYLSDFDLSESSPVMMLTDKLAVYSVAAGDYALVLTDSNFTIHSRNAFQQRIYVGIIMLLVLIVVVILTNRALTKFVFRSIMNPIQILADGVHQLRDGHLTYRIHYEKQDEFAPVCADFNEMAERLSMMVTDRQKDENNRKELIAGISHDLRTPLTSIKAYVEGLEKGVASTPQMQEKYFATIKNKTASLEHIINQLFLFSKLDIGEFPLYLELVDIGDELRKTMTAFSAEYDSKGLSIRIEGQLPHEETLIDVVQFRNVIQNILENSLKYKNKERVEVCMVCTASEHDVEIVLADDGPGVTQEELKKLFDVFYRSDSSRKNPETGSGLGLAISSKIIERLGGHIRADLAPLGGLAIRISIPKHKRTKGADYEKSSDH
ncbi:HAMP domain-containing sensor histidine kinase [Paenibacillus sinopodophylli]|uniref:HAMP domain-containing sensor histidine kinase n=1 Tax=Paenibacillus sinopodophylli TaxID=1837342 RepID=UPI00110CBA21|nr:ATP-binding protein [Paenibacillus sinopodophylli]